MVIGVGRTGTSMIGRNAAFYKRFAHVGVPALPPGLLGNQPRLIGQALPSPAVLADLDSPIIMPAEYIDENTVIRFALLSAWVPQHGVLRWINFHLVVTVTARSYIIFINEPVALEFKSRISSRRAVMTQRIPESPHDRAKRSFGNIGRYRGSKVIVTVSGKYLYILETAHEVIQGLDRKSVV